MSRTTFVCITTGCPSHMLDVAAPPHAATRLVYVGTSTGEEDEGIYAFWFDEAEGSIRSMGQVAQVMNPSSLAVSPDGRTLYAVREVEEGEVLAYRIDAGRGALRLLNRRTTRGKGPAYVSTHPMGRWVFAANYGSGEVAMLSVEDDGRLAEVADRVQHEGSGPDEDRQEGPHAHFIHPGPDGRFAYAADLGIDCVRIYGIDQEREKLSVRPVQEVASQPGAGPRHLAFHPNGRYAYLVAEMGGTVTTFALDDATGGLTELQTCSALPEDFDGFNKSSGIHVHSSGRWLYVSNRGDCDSIAVFAIDAGTGEVEPVAFQREGVHWPRAFALAPGGWHLLVGNMQANEVRVFDLDPETGLLTPHDARAEVPAPTDVTFVVGRK